MGVMPLIETIQSLRERSVHPMSSVAADKSFSVHNTCIIRCASPKPHGPTPQLCRLYGLTIDSHFLHDPRLTLASTAVATADKFITKIRFA